MCVFAVIYMRPSEKKDYLANLLIGMDIWGEWSSAWIQGHSVCSSMYGNGEACSWIWSSAWWYFVHMYHFTNPFFYWKKVWQVCKKSWNPGHQSRIVYKCCYGRTVLSWTWDVWHSILVCRSHVNLSFSTKAWKQNHEDKITKKASIHIRSRNQNYNLTYTSQSYYNGVRPTWPISSESSHRIKWYLQGCVCLTTFL